MKLEKAIKLAAEAAPIGPVPTCDPRDHQTVYGIRWEMLLSEHRRDHFDELVDVLNCLRTVALEGRVASVSYIEEKLAKAEEVEGA